MVNNSAADVQPLDLAVIIVSWNTQSLTLNCLRTLYADLASTGLAARVWVVDNASADGSAEAIRTAFPQAEVMALGKNLGFAAGNNTALRALGFHDRPAPNLDGPRAVFLLNPDTLVQPGALRVLWDALFSLPHAGIVGARLSYEDGAFQHSAFRFPGLVQIALDLELLPLPAQLRERLYNTRVNGRYAQAAYMRGAPFLVDHTLGATMMFRREAIEQTGLFDEGYFMYVEEIDWSMRVRRAGWQIYAVPAAHVVHLEGRSTRQVRPESVVNLWRSRLRFYAKHYSPAYVGLVRLLIRLGMRRKLRHAEPGLAPAYRQVLTL